MSYMNLMKQNGRPFFPVHPNGYYGTDKVNNINLQWESKVMPLLSHFLNCKYTHTLDTREVLWIDNEFTLDWVVPALSRSIA